MYGEILVFVFVRVTLSDGTIMRFVWLERANNDLNFFFSSKLFGLGLNYLNIYSRIYALIYIYVYIYTLHTSVYIIQSYNIVSRECSD